MGQGVHGFGEKPVARFIRMKAGPDCMLSPQGPGTAWAKHRRQVISAVNWNQDAHRVNADRVASRRTWFGRLFAFGSMGRPAMIPKNNH